MSKLPREHPQPEEPQSAGNPGMGCIIVLCALAMFSGILVFGIYSGWQQSRDIEKFTDTSRKPAPLVRGTTEEWNDLRSRCEEFYNAVTRGEEKWITLSVRDLNLAVANADAFQESRDQIYFEKIIPGKSKLSEESVEIALSGKICWPIQTIEFWKGSRYLNANAEFVLEFNPERTQKGDSEKSRLFLRIANLEIPDGREVNPGFLERVAQSDLLAPYKTKESKINQVLVAIEAISLDEETLMFQSRISAETSK